MLTITEIGQHLSKLQSYEEGGAFLNNSVEGGYHSTNDSTSTSNYLVESKTKILSGVEKSSDFTNCWTQMCVLCLFWGRLIVNWAPSFTRPCLLTRLVVV